MKVKRFHNLIARRKRESLLLLLFTILPLASSSWVIYLIIQHQQFLTGLSFSGWLLLFFLLAIPIALSLMPNTLAGLLAGYFLGWAGLAGMTISFSLACILGFLVGKVAGNRLLKDVIELWPKLDGYIRRFREKPFLLVTALRLLPAPPFAIGSLILAWLDLPFRKFLIASIAGMLPRMALVVFTGGLARNLETLIRQEDTDYRLILSFAVLTLLGLFLLIRNLRKITSAD